MIWLKEIVVFYIFNIVKYLIMVVNDFFLKLDINMYMYFEVE